MTAVNKIVATYIHKIDYAQLKYLIDKDYSLYDFVMFNDKKDEILGWIKIIKPFLSFDGVTADTVLIQFRGGRKEVYNLLSNNKVWLENQITICKEKIEEL